MAFSIFTCTFSISFFSYKVAFENDFPEKKRFFIALFIIFLISISPGYYIWNIFTLMDLNIWVAIQLILLGLLTSSNISYKTTISFIFLLCLTRSESLLLAPLYVILFSLRFRNFNFLKNLFLVFTFHAVIILTRITYFGYPFPNTYYAKVGPNKLENIASGWQYFKFFFSYNFWEFQMLFLLILFIVAITMIRELKSNDYKTLKIFREQSSIIYFYISLVSTIYFIYIYVGGDHFKFFRQYQVTYPLLIVILLLFYTKHKSKILFIIPSILITTFIFVSIKTIKNVPQVLKNEFEVVYDGRLVGNWLNKIKKDFFNDNNLKIALISVGGISRTYRGHIIDLAGLNDIEFAHNSNDRTGIKKPFCF